MRRAIVPWVLFGLGCGDAYRDPMIEALGGEFPGTVATEFHRPGQPCVLCHDSYEGAEPELTIGGTVFREAEDGTYVPLSVPADATQFIVRIKDSAGNSWDAPVNCIGNFFVRKGDFIPAFPVLTSVLRGAKAGPPVVNKDMISRVGRDGSCATCHKSPKSWLSPGPVFATGDDFVPADTNCPGAFR
jgi:hypothetical protein